MKKNTAKQIENTSEEDYFLNLDIVEICSSVFSLCIFFIVRPEDRIDI